MMSDAERVARMMAEIREDMETGVVPRAVRSFSQLHDYVDANGYGGYFDEPADEEHLDQHNRTADVVNAWLEAGGHLTDATD